MGDVEGNGHKTPYNNMDGIGHGSRRMKFGVLGVIAVGIGVVTLWQTAPGQTVKMAPTLLASPGSDTTVRVLEGKDVKCPAGTEKVAIGYSSSLPQIWVCVAYVVDCEGQWSEWGSCSATCGGGTQTRTFNVKQKALFGGQSCDHDGGAVEHRSCNTADCPFLVDGRQYKFYAQYGCNDGHSGDWCNAELSWDRGDGAHPMASVEFHDPMSWKLVSAGAPDLFHIKAEYGCPNGEWCGAELSWDRGYGSHPMASVEWHDPQAWKFVPVPGKVGFYHILAQYGCPNGAWCNAELSWDGQYPHAMASVETNDPMVWKMVPQ